MLKSLKSLENTLSQIIDIFDQSIQFKDCYWINEVRLILKNYSWEKIGFRILNSLSLPSPAHSSFSPPSIRNLFDSIISSLHLSQERKQCLMKRISIRQTKNPSMADLFFNHKSWAKSWKENTRICECHLLKDLLDVKLWNGHISSWHYEPKNHEYISLLRTNMNDILHPLPEKWSASFVSALTKWLVDLGKISFPSNFTFVNFLEIKFHSQPINDQIISILKLGHITPSRNLVRILTDLEAQVSKSSTDKLNLWNLWRSRNLFQKP